jgi:gliding motility-associated-like protein
MEIRDSLGCLYTEKINISSPTAIKTTAIKTIDNKCYGDADGMIVISTLGGVSPYSINWSTGVSNDTISNLTAGNYAALVEDRNGCVVSSNFEITQPDPLFASATIVSQPICNENRSGAVTLLVTGGTKPYSFWGNGRVNSSDEFTSLDSGKLIYTVVDSNGCFFEDSVQLNYQRKLSTLIPKPLIFQNNRFRMINPILSGIDSTKSVFNWSDSNDFQEQQYLQRPIVRFNSNRTIYLKVTDENGCIAIDSTEILVLMDYGKALPNTFTPNDDGLNDVFAFPKYLNILEFKVLDRFGKVLYEKIGDDPKWDGFYQNELLPQGNYVYLVKFTLPGSTELITVKGIITLLK